MWSTDIPQEEAERCLLCPEAPCTKACPHGLDPAGLLRSVRFQNIAGAADRLPDRAACTDCPAPCEAACLHPGGPIRIRRLTTSLKKELVEDFRDFPVDLSSTFCGVRLENPFLLSSSVGASSYEKMARAFEMGWPGACCKTICACLPRESPPR